MGQLRDEIVVSDEEDAPDDNAVDSGTFHIEDSGRLVMPNLPFYYTRINANKVLDGLFIGNKEASQDIEFISSIKCASIINCAGSSMTNLFSRFGVRYLTFRWLDCARSHCFDIHGKTLRQIYNFIQTPIDRGEGILVVSPHGNSRATTVLVVYLMQRFKWSVQKALEFIKFRRTEVNPKQFYIKQMKRAAKILKLSEEAPERSIEKHWLKKCEKRKELVVRNTFLNGHYIVTPDQLTPQEPLPRTRRLQFVDQATRGRSLTVTAPAQLMNTPKPWDRSVRGQSVLKGGTAYGGTQCGSEGARAAVTAKEQDPPVPAARLPTHAQPARLTAGPAAPQERHTRPDAVARLLLPQAAPEVKVTYPSRTPAPRRSGTPNGPVSTGRLRTAPAPEPEATSNRLLLTREQETTTSTTDIESVSLNESTSTSPRTQALQEVARYNYRAPPSLRSSLELNRDRLRRLGSNSSLHEEPLNGPRKRKFAPVHYKANRPVVARSAWADQEASAPRYGERTGPRNKRTSPRTRFSGAGKRSSPRTRISPRSIAARPKLNLSVMGYRKNVNSSWDSLEAADATAPSETALSQKKARRRRSATPKPRRNKVRKRRESPRRGIGARARSPSPVSRVEHPGNHLAARRAAPVMLRSTSAYDRYRSGPAWKEEAYGYKPKRSPSPHSLRPRTMKRSSSEQKLVSQLARMKFNQSARKRPGSADGPRFKNYSRMGSSRLASTAPVALRRSLYSRPSRRR